MGGRGRLRFYASRRSGLRCIRGKRRVPLRERAGVRVPQGDLEALAMEEERCLGIDAVGHGVLLRLAVGRPTAQRAASPRGPYRSRTGRRCLAVGSRGSTRTGRVRTAVPVRSRGPTGDANVGGLGNLKVAIADDSALLREGVARVLGDAGFDVVAQVSNAVELMAAITSTNPDVVVVDIRMPPTHTDEGVRAALRIRQVHPGRRRDRAVPVRRAGVRDGAARRGHRRRRATC